MGGVDEARVRQVVVVFPPLRHGATLIAAHPALRWMELDNSAMLLPHMTTYKLELCTQGPSDALVKDVDAIGDLLPLLEQSGKLAIDTELTGLGQDEVSENEYHGYFTTAQEGT